MNLQLSPEIVRSIGWALLHFVWQGAAVAAVLSILLTIVRTSSARYVLLVIGLVAMLALPFATVLYLERPVASVAPAAAERSSTADSSLVPVQSALGPAHSRSAKPAPAEAQPETMLWLVRFWMIGVVLFSLRSAGGFLVVQRLRRVATSPVTGELLRLCVAVQQRMGITRAVRFCRSAALQVPAVVGGFRPIVLLPVTALTGLSDSQIEAILAHELAHIRRLDYFVNLFQVLAETVLFYHPAIWWVNERIRTERENCCDDTAIAVCGNRLEYVRALTHLESVRLTPQFAMGADGSPLKARVRRLLGMSEEKEGVRAGNSVLGVLIVAGLVLAISSAATGAKAQSDQVKAPDAPAVVNAPPQDPGQPDGDSATEQQKTSAAVPPSRPVVVVTPNVPDINVAPVTVHVPAVKVDLPARGFHLQMAQISLPAIHVNVAPLVVHVPRTQIHGVVAQAGEAVGAPGPSYVEAMKDAGYSDLSVDDLIAMKIQGVTPEYVKQMHALGVKADPEEIVAFKIQGVTPEYVKEMRAAYPGISNDTIIGMKIQGVTAQYAAEMSKLGIKADADDLVGMKIQGVTPEYIRNMQSTGVKFDTDELIGMKIQGVTPEFVSALKSAGFTDLSADEVTGAKIQGVTPEFIAKAKSHGFKDLTLEKLIELKNAGVL